MVHDSAPLGSIISSLILSMDIAKEEGIDIIPDPFDVSLSSAEILLELVELLEIAKLETRRMPSN
jgi:hypothetical protein